MGRLRLAVEGPRGISIALRRVSLECLPPSSITVARRETLDTRGLRDGLQTVRLNGNSKRKIRSSTHQL